MTAAELVAVGERMHQALGREYYMTGSGLKGDPEFQKIYDRFRVLQQDEALAAAHESGSRELLAWVIDTRIGRKLAPLEERQLMWEQNAVVKAADREVGYLRAPIEISNSPDRSFRIALDTARMKMGSAALDGLRRDALELEHREIEGLGYDDYVAARAALSGVDLDSLGGSAERFLDETADMYVDSLGQLVHRRLGLHITQLVRSDAAWTFRANEYDRAFMADCLVQTAAMQMADMGLDVTQGGRIRFDTEEREGKQPRAFCVPVQVPHEVYLVLRPRGGHSDFRTFWHELGHSMHFSSPANDLPFEARWLGDNSVTEGFAMLWDHLTVNGLWLRHYTTLSEGEIRQLSFELGVNELYMVRRYAAKLIYELSLHRSDFTGMGAEYAERLSDATRFRYSEDECLADVDPGFYAARYLRAWQLEAALAHLLTEEYDEDWFRNPKAGEFVHALMSRGQADLAHDLALEVTGKPLAFDTLVARLEPLLH
ncbi:MAG: hypothetical protein ACE5HT_08740 [Gemmatimonadales bacterium]